MSKLDKAPKITDIVSIEKKNAHMKFVKAAELIRVKHQVVGTTPIIGPMDKTQQFICIQFSYNLFQRIL